MKILFTVQNFPPSNFGGISFSMYQIISKLSKKYEISVLTTSYMLPIPFKLEYNNWISNDNFKIKYVKTNWPLISVKYIIEGLRSIKSYDQVHLSSLFFFPNLIFAYYCFIIKKKIIWGTHGELFKPALKIKYYKKFPYLYFIKIIKNKIYFRATSKEEASQIIKKLHVSNVTIIPNFFDNEIIQSVVKKNQFLFLGRICPMKKIENLIVASSKSKLFNESDYILKIAGPIDNKFQGYYNKIKKLVLSLALTEKIVFTGNLVSPEKEYIIAQSKALCLVSDSENFGNVILEALSQGTPVIASKGTPWSVLEESASGFWINNSPEEIAFALEKFIELDESSFEIMCDNARNLAKNYCSEIVMEQWFTLLNR
jgi:glycosyltransferase involved in cell wall biosynthesis